MTCYTVAYRCDEADYDSMTLFLTKLFFRTPRIILMRFMPRNGVNCFYL